MIKEGSCWAGEVKREKNKLKEKWNGNCPQDQTGTVGQKNMKYDETFYKVSKHEVRWAIPFQTVGNFSEKRNANCKETEQILVWLSEKKN